MLYDITDYLEDILRNKSMIKDIINTNKMAYEDKIEANNILIEEIKHVIDRMNSDFKVVENKRKIEFAKSHEQYQKHEINYKLLDKTNTHYKILIKEREEDIRKLEEQIIFASQDYQNKKLKLDCVNVQIIEAEFQLNNLQKMTEEKINEIKYEENEFKYKQPNENKDQDEQDKISNFTTELKNFSENNIKANKKDKYLSEKLENYSSLDENGILSENKTAILQDNKTELFDSITLNSEHLRKTNCFIF